MNPIHFGINQNIWIYSNYSKNQINFNRKTIKIVYMISYEIMLSVLLANELQKIKRWLKANDSKYMV